MSEDIEQPKPQKQLFRVFVNAASWTEADGPTAGVFLSKPPGSRCLWACKWGSRYGGVQPDDLVSLEDITDIQTLHEAHDVSSRGDDGIGKALMSVTEGNAWKTIPVIRQMLAQARPTYPEYIFPHIPPKRDRLGMLTLRPGWGEVKEVYAKVMEG